MRRSIKCEIDVQEGKLMHQSNATISDLIVPSEGYFSRMRIYVKFMFPVPIRLLNSILLYLSFSILVCKVNHLPVDIVSWGSVLGIGNLFILAFILRLMDELKDREIDRHLFADRPLPSGMVLESDIRFTLMGFTLLLIVYNLFSLSTLWIALICLVYTYLMFTYFFVPQYLRTHLLANLATHNPSVPLFLFMVVIIVARQNHLLISQIAWPETLWIIFMFWSLVLAWELSRKIRAREEENEYVTYSRILGRVPATLITLAVQSIPLFVGYRLTVTHNVTWVCFTLLMSGFLLVLFADLRFIIAPSRLTSRLKPFSEIYAVWVFLVIIVNQLIKVKGT